MPLIHVQTKTKERLDNARAFYCEKRHISRDSMKRISYNMLITELLEEVGQ